MRPRLVRGYLLVLTLVLSTDTLGDNTPRSNQVLFTTPMGHFTVEVFTDRVPIAAQHFLQLVDQGVYKQAHFYMAMRPDTYPNIEVAPGKRFAVNAGGLLVGGFEGKNIPNATAQRLNITGIKHQDTRPLGLRHRRGSIAWGRHPKQQAQADFIIAAGEQTDFDLLNTDGQGYAIFGQVIQGLDVVEALLHQPTQGRIAENTLITYQQLTGDHNTVAAARQLLKNSLLQPTIKIINAERLK